MKKAAVLLAFLSVFVVGCATPDETLISEADKSKPFMFVESFDLSKNDIYAKSNQWIAETFVSAKSVIEMADKDAGIIIGHGIKTCVLPSGPYMLPVDYMFTIKIEIKDKRARLTFSDIKWTSGNANGDESPMVKKWSYDQVKSGFDSMENSYKSFISAKQDTF